ncbi:transporter substrate-binding domain-containing protein [Muricoccus radiodurans]|uniref:transporter substrate-binding domain-containing protein n=1 Tax=Muricoccus radiodurans TaxID=2231721 RepID=UPI003CF05441
MTDTPSRRTAFAAAAAGAVTAAALVTSKQAAAQSGPVTTEVITQRGSMIIGVVSGVPPFGIVDERGNPSGYDVDVANALARFMGVRAELVPLTPVARIPALQSRRIDVLVATLGPTPERAKTIVFPMPYSAFRLSIMAPRELQAANLRDLAGKRIAVPRGSPQDTTVTRLAMPGTNVVRFDDDATCAQAVFSRQVDAAALPDTTINQILAQNRSANAELKFAFSLQPNSMAVRKDQMELHQWLNNTIYWMKISGELDQLSQKWLNAPLPELPVF